MSKITIMSPAELSMKHWDSTIKDLQKGWDDLVRGNFNPTIIKLRFKQSRIKLLEVRVK